MIKPLTQVNIVGVTIGDGVSQGPMSFEPNAGKNAYNALLNGEDIHAFGEFSGNKIAVVMPYHNIPYATVTHSSETVDDPADALCGDGEEKITTAVGTWTLNDTFPLFGGLPVAIDFTSNDDTFVGMEVSSSGRYFNYMKTAASGKAAGSISDGMVAANQFYRTIAITGGEDVEDAAFIEWLVNNATKVE